MARAARKAGVAPPAPPAPAPPAWPADHVERRPVAALIPYASNARTHSPAQIAQLAASIREWGWTVPVLIDEAGGIIAGHGRVLAAQMLDMADIPVMVARGWTETQKRAYVLADNKLTLNGGWDESLLRIELSELRSDGVSLDLVGFDEADLASLFGSDDADDNKPGASLADRFGIAPFSVLSARDGWWQDRKRAWLALGIESETGRGDSLLNFSDTVKKVWQGQNPQGPRAKKAA